MARKPKATEAPPAPTQPRQGFVPAGQAAALLMLSTQRLRQLSAEGFIPRASKGEYPLVGVVQGYIRFLKDEERRTSKVQAESDLKATRRKEIELRIARDDHRLIETDEAIAAVEDIVGIHRSETCRRSRRGYSGPHPCGERLKRN